MNSGNHKQSPKHLSREQIMAAREHRLRKDEALGEFERDALEGWEKASGGMELMRRADRRFMPSSRLPFVIIGAVLLLLLATWFVTRPEKAIDVQKQAADAPVTVDKSDVIISGDIERLEELPAAQQIRPQQVVSGFRSKQQLKEERKAAGEPGKAEEELFALPLKKVQLYSNKPRITIDRKSAKEIYLHDFKLVDYRNYRTRQEVPSEQMVMTGTPASQERGVIQEDSPEWKMADIPYHDYISQTMEQFKSGNYKQALNRTATILKFYPDDINALFYGGLCYYNLSEADQAISCFQRVISNPFSNFDEEAFWYMANAFELKNDKARARELFQEIVSQKGYYAKQAEKSLKKL